MRSPERQYSMIAFNLFFFFQLDRTYIRRNEEFLFPETVIRLIAIK